MTVPTVASGRSSAAGALALTLLAALLSLWGLAGQHPTTDDISVAVSARTYVESGVLGPTMWYHPALRSLLVYGALKAFGSGVAGVKGVSVLLGIASVPLFWLVARRLLASETAALVATLLWTIDPLRVSFSRQAINDIYLAFFPLAALACALPALERWRPGLLVAAGALFGLGVASKWSALAPLAIVAGLLLWRTLSDPSADRAIRRARATFAAVALGLVPLAVYAATFLPWFARGYAAGDWVLLQQAMSDEVRNHQGYLPYLDGDTKAWQWFVAPVSYRDFVFQERYDFTTPPPRGEEWRYVTMFLVLPNPLTWWLVVPAAGVALARGLRRRETGIALAGSLFFASYLPLAAASRPIWLNTAMSVLPWALLCVGWLVAEVFPAGRGSGKALAAWLLLVVALAVPQYLLVLGRGLGNPTARPALERYYPGAWLRP